MGWGWYSTVQRALYSGYLSAPRHTPQPRQHVLIHLIIATALGATDGCGAHELCCSVLVTLVQVPASDRVPNEDHLEPDLTLRP
jgi:hypothetical protein